jgi:hypothetical protein
MRFAESTIRGRERIALIVKRREAEDGRFAKAKCCSAARQDAQNITKLDHDQRAAKARF